MALTTQNGWPKDPPVVRIYAGGDADGAEVRQGDVAIVFQEFLNRFHARVEPITQVNGYRTSWFNDQQPGSIKNSNHVSATAVDVNGKQHPNEITFSGKWYSGFTAAETAAVRQIIREFDNLIEWGMDFPVGTRDPMHFAIARGATAAQIHALAAKLRPVQPPLPTPTPPEEDIMATLEQMEAAIRTATAPHGFKVVGTYGIYLDLGTARRFLTAEQNNLLKVPWQDLPAGDAFWELPILGTPGELYQKEGDKTGALWSLELGKIRHVDAVEYAAWQKPPYRVLPTSHSMWTLPLATS